MQSVARAQGRLSSLPEFLWGLSGSATMWPHAVLVLVHKLPERLPPHTTACPREAQGEAQLSCHLQGEEQRQRQSHWPKPSQLAEAELGISTDRAPGVMDVTTSAAASGRSCQIPEQLLCGPLESQALAESSTRKALTAPSAQVCVPREGHATVGGAQVEQGLPFGRAWWGRS